MSRYILKHISVITIMILLAINASARIISVRDGTFMNDGIQVGDIRPDNTISLNDAYSSIQEAIDNADWGDIIEIAAGTYTETIKINKDVQLIGDGDSTYIDFSGDGPAILVENATDVSIRGLTISYNGSASRDQPRAALWVRNAAASISENTITGSGQGIRCTDGAVVEIIGNRIFENKQHGIACYPGTRITELSENEIRGNGSDGVFLEGATVENLTGNTIQDNGKAGIAALAGAHISQLLWNDISSNAERGIYLSAATVDALYGNYINYNRGKGVNAVANTQIAELSQNDILGNGSYGISLETVTVGELNNNAIQHNADTGLAAFSKTQISQLSGNDIYDNGGGGLKLAAAGVAELSSNNIWENGYGIFATDSTDIGQFADNYIYDNRGRGMHLETTTIEGLVNNTVQGNADIGIFAASKTQISQLSGNSISGSEGSGLKLADAGIERVSSNSIWENGHGIFATDGAKISQLSDNDIYNNWGYGIHLETATIEDLVRNVIQYNTDIGIFATSKTQISQLLGNDIIGNGEKGILLSAAIVGKLSSNNIRETEHGIFANDGTEISQLSWNDISDNWGTGIILKETTIEALTANIIWYNSGDGIAASSDTQISWLSRNLVCGNDLEGITLAETAVKEIHNNTIAGNAGIGLKTDGGIQGTVRNNIIVLNLWGVTLFADVPVGAVTLDLAYNDIWGNYRGDYGKRVRPGVTDIHANPMFVDFENWDFHLQAGSPLIGAGEDGVDIGAFPAVIRAMEVSGSPATEGETIVFQVTAQPNANVFFSIEGIASEIPMTEIETGVYEGEYIVLSSDRGMNIPIILQVETETGYVQADASQTVTLSGGIRSVQVAGSPAKAGDAIEVTLHADAGGFAEFSIQRIVHAIAMNEVQDGTYSGIYYVEHGDNADDAVVEVLWIDNAGLAAFDDSRTVRIDTITVFAAGSPARAGDIITITAAGKSGSHLTFSIAGIGVMDVPMSEDIDQPGIYTGRFSVKPETNVHDGTVRVTVETASGDSFVNSTAIVTIDTVPPAVLSVKTDKSVVQNGDTFEITVTSETGAFVTVDISDLDTTQTLLVLPETHRPGRYSREVVIAPENQALNGKKTLYINTFDPAGNVSDSEYQIELSNSEKPTPVERPDVFIQVNPDVLPADGQSAALVTASLAEDISSLSEIKLDIWHTTADDSRNELGPGGQNAGHLSDLQLVQWNYVTATYTSGLSVGEVILTLTILESGETMSTHVILKPPDYGNPGHIAWDYLPQYQKVFQPVRVSGKLIPQVSGETVFLTISSPDALGNRIVPMPTDPFGQFEYMLVPDRVGAWSLQFQWPGNTFYQEAKSEVRHIVVVESMTPGQLTESGWSHLTTADGLTSDQITALAQDYEDQILIGTDQGISIFNGAISWTLTTEDGLLGNRIAAIEVDSYGNVWIGSVPDGTSPGGLTLYDGFLWLEQLTKDEIGLSYVLAINEDRDGGMWLGGDGLVYFDGENLQFVSLPVESEYIVSAFAEDMRGRFWVGTDKGLFLYQSGRWSHFTKEKDKLPSDHIQALLVDSEETLWLGAFPEVDADTQESVGGGLAKYDGLSFKIFDTDNSELPSNYVTSLVEDSEGQILIGMLDGGVVRYDEWKPLSTELAGQSVNVILQDNRRQLWIGTNGGLHHFDRETFNSWEVVEGKGTFFQDSRGIIWAGSEKGLTQFNGLGWIPIQDFWDTTIYCITQHADGDIWVGTENGLSTFDGITWTHTAEVDGFALGQVTALLPDSQGRMFLGTGGGRFMLLGGEKWRDLTDKLQDLTDELGTEPKAITDFAVDPAGVLWIGTVYGLLNYDGSDVYSVGELKIEISDLVVDANGNLWVATQKGLFGFDGAKWQAHNIRNSEIASDYVAALAVDELGRVWVGTDSGLSRFDGLAFSHLSPEDAWVTFTTENSDLVDDDIRGLSVDSERQLWISTPNAVVRFTPSLRPPETDITRAPLSTVGTDSPFFEFTGNDIESETSDLVYSYKVDSGDWSPYSKSSYTILKRQSNGVHTFYVRAMDKDGNVDPTPAQRSFMVDTTSPIAVILYPAARQVIGGQIEIRGHAVDSTDFGSYTVTIRRGNQEVFEYKAQEPVDNGILASWDTRVPTESMESTDGIYNVVLVVRDEIDGPDDEMHTSMAIVPITVDNVQPVVSIHEVIEAPKSLQSSNPSKTSHGLDELDDSLSGVISIKGRATDENMKDYRLMWTETKKIDDNTVWQLIASEEVQKREIFIEQTWDSSSVYGDTTIRLVASDRAGNMKTSDTTIQLGNASAKPVVSITSPMANAVIAGIRRISGTASDSAFAGYRLAFRADEESGEWTEITAQATAVTNGKLGAWDTTAVADGKYKLRLTAMDNNGYTSVVAVTVVVDNSRPVAVIYPPDDLVRGTWIASGDVPIKGTATDVNFDSYTVEFGEGSDPDQWTSIEGASELQVEYGILRTWSTAGLNGEYTLRLTVTNKADLETVFPQPITLDNQPAEASITSPEEGQFVTGVVSVTGVADDENFRRYQIMVAQGQEPATWGEPLEESSAPRQEDVLFNWDTTSLEGEYSIKLVVEDFSNDPVEETRHVTVDNTPPQAEITAPQDGQMVSGDIEIRGTAQDEHFQDYLVEYASGTNPLDNAWREIGGLAVQPVTDGVLRNWNAATLSDGLYSLRLTVRDSAGHVETVQSVLILDNQPPEAKLNVPTINGIVTGTVDIIGTASDLNLKEYKLLIAPGEQVDEADWRLISSGVESKTNSALAQWDTAGLEGTYSVKLIATDLSDQGTAEDTQIVVIDNTDPVALITSPQDNYQVGGIIQVSGTAIDANFKEYIVEFGKGTAPQIWTKATTMEYHAPVEAGELMQWFAEDRTGTFTLRLTVTDQVAHTSTATVTIDIISPITESEGGDRESSDGVVALYLPPRALRDDTLVSVNPTPETDDTNAPSGTVIVGRAYELGPKDAKISRSKPATLSISYDGLDAPSPGKELVIARFDGSRWVPIGGTVNETERVVTTAITEFGRYALMEIDSSKLNAGATITRLTCQPRILSPNGSGFSTETTISFHLGQPAAVSIMIYNRAGELVSTLVEEKAMSTGVNAVQWNGRDEDGGLPSNMYIVAVRSGDQFAYKTVGIVNR